MVDIERIVRRAAAPVIDRLVNPARLHDDDRLWEAVSGKIVLVTGASYGVGEATARLFGKARATVLLTARTEERLAEVAAAITAAGGTAYVYPVNLADPSAAEDLAKAVLTRHGHVDIVVSNAGLSIRRSVELQYDRFHDFERTTGVNYLGPVQLLLGLLPSMRERRSGQIVNISTIGVRMPPSPRWGAYQASKAAFDTWLRSITAEIEPDGVHVSTLYLGLVYTRMSAPTPGLRQLPGLRPDEAARLVARAVVERPREIAPWWVGPAELSGVLLRKPLQWGMRLMFERSSDTRSARGDRA